MDQRKTLSNYIKRARRSLMVEKIVPILQYGVLSMVAVCTLVLLVSRLFVFPYYGDVAFVSGIAALLLTGVYIWVKRVRKKEALMKLDEHYPNNELVTSLSFEDDGNPLVKSLLQKAVTASEPSYQKFKQRKKKLWRPPVLISILLTSILLGLLISFPSETQREAAAIEKENEIIKDLKKEIAKMEKQVNNKENKRQLEELKDRLKNIDSAEKALREVVKKQKELQLQELKLQENQGKNGEGLTNEQKEQLKELAKMQKELKNNLQNTKSQLTKYGTQISNDLLSEIASLSNNNSNSNNQNKNNQNNPNNQNNGNNNSVANNQNNNKSGSSNNQSNNNNKNQTNGNNNGNNNGNGNGNGSGNGNGNRPGSGSGGGGSKGGIGQGTRELLAIPKRIGEKGDVTVDSGPLGSSGNSNKQKGTVQATKGSVQPYSEVIGDYKNSYFESSQRMQLPKDLQSIVQSYFSSIEED